MSVVSRITAVFAKEVRDTSRDRRTALVALLTAVAAGPIFLLLIFNLIASQAERARELKLPTVGLSHAPALKAFLERNQVTVSDAPDDYEAKLRTGEFDVVLVVDPAFTTDVTPSSSVT